VPGEAPLPGVPNLALREERAPNVTGARLVGYTSQTDAATRALEDGALLLVVDDELENIPPALLASVSTLVFLGTRLPEAARVASVVLPIANMAEEDGTFVNRDGRVQRYFQATLAPGMARPAWWVLGELLREVRGTGDSPMAAAEAFDMMARAEPSLAGLSYAVLGVRGAVLPAGSPAAVGA
jgi:NADH-quinone oxidoreductase subunit G